MSDLSRYVSLPGQVEQWVSVIAAVKKLLAAVEKDGGTDLVLKEWVTNADAVFSNYLQCVGSVPTPAPPAAKPSGTWAGPFEK
jgi:hypothetical protein